ncbi:MAG: UTP--glucose-1-phosphate uridylyltransferase [Chlamydiia bacterium]|nr:UTP--glucose-1-phosphate uridylyltransferase [Chlamydiia bacterium]
MPSLPPDNHQVGILYLAGGQGTRLGFNGPKGCVKLPLKEEKTLFQIHLEKIKEADSVIAIMTSPLNHEQTRLYLEGEHYFGFKNVSLFQQGMENGYPDGNGKAFAYFGDAGLWDVWEKKGIKWVQVIPIDNPLATPFDPELLAENRSVELVLRGVKRLDKSEKMGVIFQGDHLEIKEYTEVTEPRQDLLGNTGLFSCTMNFARRSKTIPLSSHIVRKKMNGEWIEKKEYFIFDLFPYACSYKVIESDRKKCFAPLKNASGPDSLETVARALMT